jgi:hypothetical protein
MAKVQNDEVVCLNGLEICLYVGQRGEGRSKGLVTGHEAEKIGAK